MVLAVYKYRAGFLIILAIICLQFDHQLSLLYILGSSLDTLDNVTSDQTQYLRPLAPEHVVVQYTHYVS